MKTPFNPLIMALVFACACAYASEEEEIDLKETEEETEAALSVDTLKGVSFVMTPQVQRWLKRYTGKSRPKMQKWLNISSKYMPLVKDIFQSVGVPHDLVVLASTESGYDPHAYSRAKAAGMWQFVHKTGQLYGLEIDDWIDERRDFEKATLAAAQHLKDLYEIFNDWYLALAAYNAGPKKIEKAIKNHGTTDFFKLVSKGALKRETQNYVPSYLAQLHIFRNPDEYGFEIQGEPLLFDKVEMQSHANIFVIARHLGCSVDELKRLNPELRTPMTPPQYTLRVPAGAKDTLTKLIEDENTDLARYHVYYADPGEDIANIAMAHGVSLSSIKKLNNLKNNKMRESKILFIPRPDNDYNEYDVAFAKNIADPWFNTTRY
jgi:membrane-bound lytic murein transglycosylase D